MIKKLVNEHLECEKERKELQEKIAELYEKDQDHRRRVVQALNTQFSLIELFPFLLEEDVVTLCENCNVVKTLSYAGNSFDISLYISDTELCIEVWSESDISPGIDAWCWDLMEVEDKIQEVKDAVEIVMKDRLAFVETALKHFGSLK